MWALLSIVIGIVFVLLLFSLLATTVMEMLSGLLSLRGKNLLNAIRGMLGENTTQIFTNHEYFKQLSERPNLLPSFRKKHLPPSYVRPGTFTAILMDILQVNSTGAAKEAIEQLPAGKLRDILTFLHNESGDDIAAFRKKVEEWFNEVMERASEWYINNVRVWLVGVGLTIAVFFNVDVLSIYKTLSANAALREEIADMATKYVNTQPAPGAFNPNAGFEESRQKAQQLLTENIDVIRSPLGIGWTDDQWNSMGDSEWWLYKVMGWLTTALAMSLGANFWFNLLKALVSFRGGGASGAGTTQIVVQQPGGASGVVAAAAVANTPAPILTRPADGLFESMSSKPKSAKRPAPSKKTKEKDGEG